MDNLLTGNLSSWLQTYFWVLIIVAVVLVAVIVYFIYHRKPKQNVQVLLEDEKIDEFIECYGTMKNINNAELDGRRLKLTLKDIKKVNLERFNTLGATGIFITGNQIKMVLPYDMQKLVDYIKFNQSEGKK